MKIETGKIINAYDILSKIANKEMPFKSAVIIAKNIKEMESIYTLFMKKRTEYIKLYAKKDEDGNPIYNEEDGIMIENIQELNGKLNEMAQTEVEVELNMINQDALENIELSPIDYLNIDFLID